MVMVYVETTITVLALPTPIKPMLMATARVMYVVCLRHLRLSCSLQNCSAFTDACPHDSQNDIDADGVCGDHDNCPSTANSNQANADADTLGDACGITLAWCY